MSNFLRYCGDESRGPSPAIWGDMAKVIADKHAGMCVLVSEEFEKWNTSTTNGTSVVNGWTVVADDGPVLQAITDPDPAAGELGVVLMTGADADNDELYLCNQGVAGGSFKTDYQGGKIMFECRIKKIGVTDAGLTFFAGLARYELAVAGTLVANAGTLIATGDFIGFSQDDLNGDSVHCIYQDASQTQVQSKADAVALTTDTWVKLGFVYDPVGSPTDCLRFYADGVRIANTKVTAAVAAATGFPNAVVMNALIGFLHEGTAHEKAEIDWIHACQYVGPAL
jgi:hypothetical protein